MKTTIKDCNKKNNKVRFITEFILDSLVFISYSGQKHDIKNRGKINQLSSLGFEFQGRRHVFQKVSVLAVFKLFFG